MSSSSDYMVDRRRLRRKLGFWRIAAIGAALLAALVTVSEKLLLAGMNEKFRNFGWLGAS